MRSTAVTSEVPAAIRRPEDVDESLLASGDNDADDASIATVKDDDTDDSTSAEEDMNVHDSTSAEEDNDIRDSTSTEEESNDDESRSQAEGGQSQSKPPHKSRSKRLPQAYDANKPPKKEADEAEVEQLHHALWQRQDKDWTISRHHLSAFQNLCFRHKLSWRGNKADLYERIRTVVCPSGRHGVVKS